MRTVRGEAFRFVWNTDASAFTMAGYKASLAYPGDVYVNDIGLDVYDQSWVTPQTFATAWNKTTLPALDSARAFASARRIPIAITEWGVTIRSDGHGLGDDPFYVNSLTSWMRNPVNNVVYESYFDADTVWPGTGTVNTEITGGRFPKSLAAFISDLGPGTT